MWERPWSYGLESFKDSHTMVSELKKKLYEAHSEFERSLSMHEAFDHMTKSAGECQQGIINYIQNKRQ